MADVLAQRRRERERLVARAGAYVARLSARLPVLAAAVVGSVARGDFNVWSDVDVVVIATGLPQRAPDRAGVLARDAPAGLQAIGFTPEEFEAAWAKGNPLAREATGAGVTLLGEGFLGAYGGTSDR